MQQASDFCNRIFGAVKMNVVKNALLKKGWLQFDRSRRNDVGICYLINETDQNVCLCLGELTTSFGDSAKVKKKMGKTYRNPPIVEAVCEFRLAPNAKWDITSPGMIYEQVRNEFRIKEQSVFQQSVVTSGPTGAPPILSKVESVRFLSDDKLRLIQVAPRILAINCLRPYPSWEGFKPMIENAFDVLTDVTQADFFQRIGLMYVNRIEIPSPSATIKLDEYFEYRLFLGQNLPKNVASFMVGSIFPFENGRDLCRVELITAMPEKPKHAACILTLDYFLAKPKAFSAPEVRDWVENAHQNIETTFEGCITDSLRRIFEEV